MLNLTEPEGAGDSCNLLLGFSVHLTLLILNPGTRNGLHSNADSRCDGGIGSDCARDSTCCDTSTCRAAFQQK